MRAFVVAAGVGSLLAWAGLSLRAADVEVGTVNWGRDLDAASEASSSSGKPVLVLFQEVPGCVGCKRFGREVLSHERIVEAIESEFEPVVVYNNRPGRDAEILKQFREPAWNFQVIRFLDSSGNDLIPRRDGIWTVEDLAARMVSALEAADREVPRYLRALAGTKAAGEPARAAFAMFCFWTGELRFGGLEGVLVTEAGWIEGREVTLVTFDRSVLPFADLLARGVSFDCARKVYTEVPADATVAKRSRLSVGSLDDGYRPAGASDQERQVGGTPFASLDLSPVQATKVNAFARTEPEKALAWLSPKQLAALGSP